MNKIKSNMAMIGLVGTLAIGSTGCTVTGSVDKAIKDIKEKIFLNNIEESEELPYKIYDESYYYDENDVLHQLIKTTLIENVTESIVEYIPEGYVVKSSPAGDKVFEEREVVKIIDGKKTTVINCFEVEFNHGYHQISVYDSPELTDNKITELVKTTAANHGIDYPTKIHVMVCEYLLPEGAYVLEEDFYNGIPRWCYIDKIVTDELTKNEVNQKILKKL